MEALHTIRREAGATVVIVTHDTAMAARADRVFHLVDGCMTADREIDATEEASLEKKS